jgi:hypothetical protein
LQLKYQLIEAFVDVACLLFVKALNFLLNVLNKLSVVIVDPFGVEHELIEVIYVLLYNISHVF